MIPVVYIVYFVQHLAFRRERAKAVGKTAGDKNHFLVFPGEFEAVPLTEGGRIMAQIYKNIQHTAANAAHELGFGERRKLKMQAPDNAAAFAARVIFLHPGPVQAGLLEYTGIVSAHEKSPFILNGFQLDFINAF